MSMITSNESRLKTNQSGTGEAGTGEAKNIMVGAVTCRIAHNPFKYPGSGGGSLCARWGGTHQHPAIPNFTQRSRVVLSIFKRAILKPVFKPPRRKHTWVSSFNGSRNCPARIIELFPRIHNFEFQNFQVEFFRDTSNHQPTLAAPCPPLIPCTTSPPPSDRR